MRHEKSPRNDKTSPSDNLHSERIRGLDPDTRQAIDAEVLHNAEQLEGDLSDAFLSAVPFEPFLELGVDCDIQALALEPGQRVFVASLVTEGTIVKDLSSNRFEVNIGGNKTVICEGKYLASLSQPADLDVKASCGSGASSEPSGKNKGSSTMLDFHGFTTRQALEALDRFFASREIQHCAMLKLNHGKGTGKVKEALHTALADTYKSRIKEFALDSANHGITWVKLNGF